MNINTKSLRKHLRAFVTAFLLVGFVAACAKQTFDVSGDGMMMGDDMMMAANADDISTFYLLGVNQTDMIDPVAVCGGADKVSKVETEITFMNGLLTGVTLGIYAPRQYRVYCKQ